MKKITTTILILLLIVSSMSTFANTDPYAIENADYDGGSLVIFDEGSDDEIWCEYITRAYSAESFGNDKYQQWTTAFYKKAILKDKEFINFETVGNITPIVDQNSICVFVHFDNPVKTKEIVTAQFINNDGYLSPEYPIQWEDSRRIVGHFNSVYSDLDKNGNMKKQHDNKVPDGSMGITNEIFPFFYINVGDKRTGIFKTYENNYRYEDWSISVKNMNEIIKNEYNENNPIKYGDLCYSSVSMFTKWYESLQVVDPSWVDIDQIPMSPYLLHGELKIQNPKTPETKSMFVSEEQTPGSEPTSEIIPESTFVPEVPKVSEPILTPEIVVPVPETVIKTETKPTKPTKTIVVLGLFLLFFLFLYKNKNIVECYDKDNKHLKNISYKLFNYDRDKEQIYCKKTKLPNGTIKFEATSSVIELIMNNEKPLLNNSDFIVKKV